eukprot:TRINITY_DN3867_c0_g1_i3.p1 TRINITY_DN3867_c0_g1~~TRINITY_DN3867_c0_g1_i3.p1  ORF type:complete len:329 (-),score=59.41 TRINITY_DN3867_c0_g1_i3:15-1001(-)
MNQTLSDLPLEIWIKIFNYVDPHTNPLHLACQYYPTFVSFMLPKNDDKNHHYKYPTITTNNIDAVNTTGETCLMVATRWNPSVVPILILAGADPNYHTRKSSETALLLACKYQPKAVEMLLQAGADANYSTQDNITILLTALIYQPETIPKLHQYGANINQTHGYLQITPLVYACIHNLYKEVEILLECGADPNIVPKDRSTALMHAVVHTPKAVSLLIESNANLEKVNKEGMTALMIACKYSPSVVECILQAGAEVNIAVSDSCINNKGYTPLLYASRYQPDIVRLLLSYGADIKKSYRGDTAIDFARSYCHYDALDLLESWENESK